jgi:hypothetical protein
MNRCPPTDPVCQDCILYCHCLDIHKTWSSMDCHNARAKAVSCKLQVDSRADERDDVLCSLHFSCSNCGLAPSVSLSIYIQLKLK